MDGNVVTSDETIITLEVKPEVEARLRENAARRHQTLEAYAAEWLEQAPEEEPLPSTPSEALAYWDRVGVYNVFGDNPDSPELSRQWRDREQARLRTL